MSTGSARFSAEKGLRLEFTGRVADEHAADGDEAAGMVPEGRTGSDIPEAFALAIPAVELHAAPTRLQIGQALRQSWLAAPDDAWRP
jgi:hypothetical protein